MAACAQVEDRGQRMQEDYRLDYGVAQACEPDVTAFCAAEKVPLLAQPPLPGSSACCPAVATRTPLPVLSLMFCCSVASRLTHHSFDPSRSEVFHEHPSALCFLTYVAM
jgi:hypothetical protein